MTKVESLTSREANTESLLGPIKGQKKVIQFQLRP